MVAGENETDHKPLRIGRELRSSSSDLLINMLKNLTADDDTFKELIQIILVKREDAKKDFRTISFALSRGSIVTARILPSCRCCRTQAVQKLTREEVLGLIPRLLQLQTHT